MRNTKKEQELILNNKKQLLKISDSMKNIQFNQNLSDDIFTVRRLEKGM